MKKSIFLVSAALLCLQLSAQETPPTLQSVTANGNSTNIQITVGTAVGGAMYTGRQIGTGYGNPNAAGAVFTAKTDATWSSNVFLFSGYHSTNATVGSGTNSFYVRGDGQGYFAGRLGIGTNAPKAMLDVAPLISGGTTGTVLARQLEGNGSGEGTYLGVKAWGTQASDYEGKSFSLEHRFYGYVNGAINFFRGPGSIGGYITFATDNGNEKMRINSNGNIGIGTTNPGTYKLAVEGTVGARKVKVTQDSWADYVFDSSYQLLPLKEVEGFIKNNKHLPGVPSAIEVKKDGLDLGDSQAMLLKKIEELTLYIIQQNTKMEKMESELDKLKTIVNASK